MTTIPSAQTAEVRIYQGDDFPRMAELRRALDVAQRAEALNGVRRLGDADEVAEARAALEAFVDEASERAVTVRLRAVNWRTWRNLRAEHPARQVEDNEGRKVDHEDDMGLGINTDTFPEPLLRLSIVEPEMTPAELDAFIDSLSPGMFDKLWRTAYFLNAAEPTDPKDETL